MPSTNGRKHLEIIDGVSIDQPGLGEQRPTIAACGKTWYGYTKDQIIAWTIKMGPTNYRESKGSLPTCKTCAEILKYPALHSEWGK